MLVQRVLSQPAALGVDPQYALRSMHAALSKNMWPSYVRSEIMESQSLQDRLSIIETLYSSAEQSVIAP